MRVKSPTTPLPAHKEPVGGISFVGAGVDGVVVVTVVRT